MSSIVKTRASLFSGLTDPFRPTKAADDSDGNGRFELDDLAGIKGDGPAIELVAGAFPGDVTDRQGN